MTEQELIKGYETEINYQKHMLENLKRWISLFFMVASLGLLGVYFSTGHHWSLTLISSLISLVSCLGMLLFGYGIYKGRQNLIKVIDDFEAKLSQIKEIKP